MSYYVAKLCIGAILMVTHFGSIGFLVIAGRQFIDFDPLVSSVLILTPLTVTYVTLFLKDLMRLQFVGVEVDGLQIRVSAFIFQLVFLALFASALFGSIGIYVWQGTMSSEQFKIVLGIVESGFGVFIGTITSSIFGPPR